MLWKLWRAKEEVKPYSAPVTPLERVIKEVRLPQDRGHRKKLADLSGDGTTQRWAGGHGTAKNLLCILRAMRMRKIALLWAMTSGSVVLESRGLLWKGGREG